MKIRDCFDINPLNNTNKYKDYINYIDTSSVIEGKLLKVEYLNINYPSRAQRKVKKGDIIYSSVRPNLKHFYFYNDDIAHVIASTGFILLRAKNENTQNAKFLYYYLTTQRIVDYLSGIAELSQATFPSFSSKDLEKINIPTIERHQQDKIVEILSNYDLTIENNNKRIKILEKMAENLYKEWFVRFRFPGHEKKEFENGMPKGWKIERISDIGKVIGGGTPSTEIKEYWNGIIPWLTPADLAEFKGIYIEKGKNNITDLGLKKSSTKLLPKDTVLLSSRAPIGYVALARNEICTNQGFKSVICNEEIIKHQYLFYYFKMNKQLLEGFGSGATFLELSAKSLNKIKILVPKFELQKEFSKVVDNIFDEIFCLSNKNSNLTKQRDLLLPRLMSGKLAC